MLFQKLYLTSSLLLLILLSNAQSNITVERSTVLMGSIFQITVVAKDSASANFLIDKSIEEISRIENLISEWQPHTQISIVNSNAGIRPVKVSPEVFELTKRAIYYSSISNGAFDISTASMDKIWRFDGTMDSLPNPTLIKNSIKNVDFRNIILDSINLTIFLRNKGMKIGFGSIGKAYAADKAKELMTDTYGVSAGIINASGDITAWGIRPDNKPWLIGIKNPFSRKKTVKALKLINSAVATSGSYEKYVEIDNIRYSHIINPQTGYPSKDLISVTIIGPSCEFANALSTSIMVLGEKEGIKLMEKFLDYKFLIITDKGKKIKN